MTKVLCLHGCNQNPEAFASYLNSVTKMGKKSGIEFIFLKAPFEHPLGNLTWTNPPLNVEDIWEGDSALTATPKLPVDYNILEETFALLDKEIERTGATVLLGFSQGSFAIYEYMRFTKDARIKRLVAMSGYTFRDTILDGIQTRSDQVFQPMDVDLLNVVHPMDNIVPASLAYQNTKRVFEIRHNNKELKEPSREGHVTPTRSVHTKAITQFILTGSI